MHREELSKEAQLDLVDKAIVGDGQALEELLRSTSGLVFNLALRFLGTVHDAEDASQEIAVKIMTRLSTFRKESAFSTWVYRIAVNHLKDCRTHQFANAPFSFEMYGADIVDERAKDVPDLSEGVDRGMLARELKLSIFDEPEAGIDLWSFSKLVETFRTLHERNRQDILLISHQERIMQLADEMIVIENGKVAARGSKDEILPTLLLEFEPCGINKKAGDGYAG